VPLSWTLDHPGPLTRTVRDAAIVMQAISGRDALDPTTEDVAVPDMLDGIERGAKGLRIGVPKQFFWHDVEPEVEALVRKAIADLEAAGASVREVEYPQIGQYQSAQMSIMFADALAYHAPHYPSRKADYGAQVAFLLDLGASVTGVAYAAAMQVVRTARRGGADAVLDGVDVLAVPTMPVAAPSIEASRANDPGARMSALTSVFDLTGQPVMSVPCGLTAAGLPAGISFAGRCWDEASVLRAGRAYEQVRGPFPAPPIA
jgi:aspartyl-tRNA(Asn)/glutamyl-tRNA(Gln) amidotransferase subunit A